MLYEKPCWPVLQRGDESHNVFSEKRRHQESFDLIFKPTTSLSVPQDPWPFAHADTLPKLCEFSYQPSVPRPNSAGHACFKGKVLMIPGGSGMLRRTGISLALATAGELDHQSQVIERGPS